MAKGRVFRKFCEGLLDVLLVAGFFATQAFVATGGLQPLMS
jgi:hypothetical protein